MIPADFRLQSYAFPLPEERIAQEPAAARASSRLMVLRREDGGVSLGNFPDILRHLPEKCLLVANNARVIPARLFGRRPGGGAAEFLLLTPPPLLETEETADGKRAGAEGLVRPSGKVRPGESLVFGRDFSLLLEERREFGRWRVTIRWRGNLPPLLDRYGLLPLPPYIKRPAGAADAERYQTVYARADKAGALAAPTAGLHFTPDLRRRLRESGRDWAEITLYVGYGTFSPVRCEDIREHALHEEYVEAPRETLQAVAKARAEGRAVVAVGTTSVRALEGIRREGGGLPPEGFSGPVRLFLYPGKSFQVVDGLITNFHLPRSSLLMLTAALAGREAVLAAYARAVREGFRFFSYGDAMLIL
ncbi:MAG: tRNA preQ1(34) S-adenosylmethionine ribosyltransferase-isomerase QueA [Desulfovibrio sp.]|nr:tRNA preQ1(34) S-adenosylmethionine ribosyltransferase-isomerase QueA [Desulfovibrio sp.]